MIFSFRALRQGVLVFACLTSASASASVVIATTRVIYPAEQAEVTVKLSNEGRNPSLVQAWIDDGQPQAPVETLQMPFDLMPPMFRLEPGRAQSLRLFHDGTPLPDDRESLFWLNVLDLPPKAAGNALQLSLRTRIKLIYRPADLQGRARDAHLQLTWQLTQQPQGWQLQAHNPSPYFIHLSGLELRHGEHVLQGEPSHVAPFASTRFPLKGTDAPALSGWQVHYGVIDDHGAVREGVAPVTAAR